MISINVTSDSSVSELKLTAEFISKLADSRSDCKSEVTVKLDASEVMPMVHEAIQRAKAEVINAEMIKAYAITTNCSTIKAEHDLNNGGSVHIQDKDYVTAITPDGISHVSRPSSSQIFNTTELAEAEQLGKYVASTAVADQSTTAHVDTTVNTSIPTPQSVFGQAVQTNVNVEIPVASATPNPVLDAKGREWDARIHSSAKSFVKDGTWKYKKGVDANLVDEIEGNSVNVETIDQREPVFVSTVPPAPQVSDVNTTTFPQLLDMVTSAMVAGNLTQAELTEVLNSVGVTALPLLMGKPDLIAEVERLLNK